MVFLLLVGVDPRKKEQAITEDELRTIVDVSHEEGVLEHDEHEMINNLFDFIFQSKNIWHNFNSPLFE